MSKPLSSVYSDWYWPNRSASITAHRLSQSRTSVTELVKRKLAASENGVEPLEASSDSRREVNVASECFSACSLTSKSAYTVVKASVAKLTSRVEATITAVRPLSRRDYGSSWNGTYPRVVVAVLASR